MSFFDLYIYLSYGLLHIYLVFQSIFPNGLDV